MYSSTGAAGIDLTSEDKPVEQPQQQQDAAPVRQLRSTAAPNHCEPAPAAEVEQGGSSAAVNNQDKMEKMFPVGSRALYQSTEGALIVDHECDFVVIALDSGDFIDVLHEKVATDLFPTDDDGPGLFEGKKIGFQKAVVNVYQGRKVTGVAYGDVSELMFRGQAPAYYAHVARPFYARRGSGSNSERQNPENPTYRDQTFSMGDVVENKVTGKRAAVVRCVIRQHESAQMRRLLVLLRLDGDAPKGPPTSEMAARMLFPGSWKNWERVPRSGSGWVKFDNPYAMHQPRLLLTDQQMDYTQDLIKLLPPDTPHMTTLSAALHAASDTPYATAKRNKEKERKDLASQRAQTGPTSSVSHAGHVL